MPTEVVRYKTADGELFQDERAAEAHVLDRCREIVDKATASLLGPNFTRSDQVRFITALLPDYGAACELVTKLEHEIEG